MGVKLWPTDPVPCRDDLAEVAQSYFWKNGSAAEIGVHTGEFAQKNLRHWKGLYYMIDTWRHRADDGNDKNWENQTKHDAHKREAILSTRFAGGRARPIKGYSMAVSKRFADNSLDWVYIDAGHTYEAVMADLNAWYPKVRLGGLISGDDYADANYTPMMSPSRWVYGTGQYFSKYYNFGVVRATTEFAR